MARVDLRTDPRARGLWDKTQQLLTILAELTDPDMPPPLETLYVRLRRARSPHIPCVIFQKEVEKLIGLVNSVFEHGLWNEDDIKVRIRVQTDGTEVFEFADGTHRACIQLALGRPVMAECIGRVEVDRDLALASQTPPLDRYPLTEETE